MLCDHSGDNQEVAGNIGAWLAGMQAASAVEITEIG
jgi:hypothetical protein